MNGSKNAGSCGSALYQIFTKNLIGIFRIVKALVLLFFCKCVRVQPVNEFQIHPDSTKRILWRMYMQIHQSWKNQSVTIIHTGKAFIFLW